MPEQWRYRGQTIDTGQLTFVREFLAAHPGSSRWKLSRQLCETLEWKQPNGALRDVVCRGLPLLLERAGEIVLPPVRRHIQGQCRSARLRPEPLPIDTTPLALPLSDLGGIEIQSVRRTADEPLFHSLMEQYHYLGYRQPVGEHLRYLVWAHNTRFPILPWVKVPHLASHILGRMAARISADWEARYAHPISLLEIFVDPQRLRGTCYLAANWKVLGETTGRGKADRTHRPNRSSGCRRCLCTAGFGNG